MAFFRFLDLPAEIRDLIYRNCFFNTMLGLDEVDGRKFLGIYTHDGGHLDSNTAFGGPSLLVVSKQVQQECLPFFAQSIEYLEVRNHSNFEIPPAYLTSLKEVRLESPHVQLFDRRTCPNLQLLRIDLSTAAEGNFDIISGSNKEELRKSVVLKARARFWATRVHKELGKIRSTDSEALPFKILLDLGSGSLMYRHRGRSYLLEDVVVDWQRQEVIVDGHLRYVSASPQN